MGTASFVMTWRCGIRTSSSDPASLAASAQEERLIGQMVRSVLGQARSDLRVS